MGRLFAAGGADAGDNVVGVLDGEAVGDGDGGDVLVFKAVGATAFAAVDVDVLAIVVVVVIRAYA